MTVTQQDIDWARAWIAGNPSAPSSASLGRFLSAYFEQKAEIERLERIEAAARLVKQDAGIVFEDPRGKYFELRASRVVWEPFRAALSDSEAAE